jgi:hypothetical protein
VRGLSQEAADHPGVDGAPSYRRTTPPMLQRKTAASAVACGGCCGRGGRDSKAIRAVSPDDPARVFPEPYLTIEGPDPAPDSAYASPRCSAVAPDPIAGALTAALHAWLTGADRAMLRRALLGLLVILDR